MVNGTTGGANHGMRTWRASLAATAVMGGIMLLLFFAKLLPASPRFILAAPLPPDMLFTFAAWFAGVPWVFNLIHSLPNAIGYNAEYILFVVVFLVYLGAWLVFGSYYGRLAASLRPWGADLAYGVAAVLVTGLVLLPVQPPGLGVFGLSPNNFQYPPRASALWAAFFGMLFAATLHLVARVGAGVGQDHDPQRRESLRTLLGGVMAISALAAFGRVLVGAAARAQVAAAGTAAALVAHIKGVVPEITPVAEHYVVDKDIFAPGLSADRWSLKVSGLVERPLEVSFEQLAAMPAVRRASTLTCVSNPVGGDLIGNSVWTGVRLNELLRLAGVKPQASEIVLHAADNYSDSFPLATGLADSVIVAYLQDDEPLTRDHGFPARVLVPGIYGMKNVKWVVDIELTAHDFRGFWQQRGWSDTAVVKTMSRIDTPRATQLEDGRWAIGGISFAGLRGVRKVEVSLDDGASWQAAELKPAVNDLSWNLWGFRWKAAPGSYEVLVRATDGSGTTQTAVPSRPLPDGASGYHRLRVRVG